MVHGPQADILSRTEPPTFAAIISPARLLQGSADGAARQRRLDQDLAPIVITAQTTVRRCARYDHERPALPAKLSHPAILVFDKINGFRDGPSVDAGTMALQAMAIRSGWALVFTDKAGVFNPVDLARFDAVVWNNVSGDALTVPQEAAFRQWLEAGGGFAGFHGSGGDLVYAWDWYVDSLIGARFNDHPFNPQFQTARVRVSEPGVGITRGMPATWLMAEENGIPFTITHEQQDLTFWPCWTSPAIHRWAGLGKISGWGTTRSPGHGVWGAVVRSIPLSAIVLSPILSQTACGYSSKASPGPPELGRPVAPMAMRWPIYHSKRSFRPTD